MHEGVITTTASNLKSDADGKVNFSIGATLYTDSRAGSPNTGAYIDKEIYTGSFSITVNY